MKADLIERMNQMLDAHPLYLSGQTVSVLFPETLETTDHQTIEDDALYCFSELGIWEVE